MRHDGVDHPHLEGLLGAVVSLSAAPSSFVAADHGADLGPDRRERSVRVCRALPQSERMPRQEITDRDRGLRCQTVKSIEVRGFSACRLATGCASRHRPSSAVAAPRRGGDGRLVTTVTELSVTRLTIDDIEDNVALAREVGWPDTESDWTVLHRGAIVVGVRAEGGLVGQGALGLYGQAGTIAKMIVAPRFQRHGMGQQILEVVLAEAQHRALTVLGLVATPFGRPLYARAGFVSVGEVVGLGGVPTAPFTGDATTPLEGVEGMLRLDERWLGCSRESMLRARFGEAVATASVLGPDGELCGYAMATAQREHFVIGPVVAETEGRARALVGSILRSLPGPVRLDVPGEKSAFRAWLCTLGLREQKTRPEMARGCDRLPWQVPERFALAAQAWG